MVRLVKPQVVSGKRDPAPSQELLSGTGFKIVLKEVERPFSHSIEQELDWICDSLGFFERIDTV